VSEVREALTAANAGALIPKVISPSLLELVRRYSPLVRTIPTEHWTTDTYYFNRRSALPATSFVVDGGAAPVSNSTYEQKNFPIKLLQGVGAVTGFAQAVTSGQIGSLLQKEMDGMRQGLIWNIENNMLWGSAAATASGSYPQFDGLDNLVNTFSGNTQNALQYTGALALSNFDHLVDLVEENAATPTTSGGWIFVTSPAAESKVGQLLTNQQRFVSVEVAPGLNVSSYRDIPIIKSSFLAARSATMGTITTATSTSGGTLAAAATGWKYQVSAVISRYGETLPCTEVNQVTTGSTSTVTLTVAAPSGMPDGGVPVLYKVYRTLVNGATGTETLIGVVDAFDTGGTAVTSIIDTGTNLLTNASGTTGPAAYVAASGASPLTTGQESMYLIPINPDFLVRPYVRDLEAIPLSPTTTGPDQLPFAIVSDTTLAVRSSKYMARATGFTVATSGW
jgi:hypothetical protein